jgi:predicted RNA-binding Zn-ribbon protein involved in translation (DUF1610 family)
MMNETGFFCFSCDRDLKKDPASTHGDKVIFINGKYTCPDCGFSWTDYDMRLDKERITPFDLRHTGD